MSEITENKIIPINPGVAREMAGLIEKSWESSNNDDIANEIFSTELRAFIDSATLKSLFFSEDWVFIVIDLISNKISSQPLLVMNSRVDAEGNKIVSSAPDHPLNELIQQPNEWQSYAHWMYGTVLELYLMGNAIIWHAPRSGQLITMPTENVTIDFNSDGSIKSYVVANVKEENGIREMQSLQTFKADEIIHLRRPNPKSLLWGLSPFIPGRKSVLFNRYSQDYLNAFYLKQATPGLALSLDRSVNEDVALRQLRSFEVAYQGRKNMRRTLILPKGVDVKPLTHTLSDQKLLEHIRLNRESICGLLKVPKHELGLQEAGSLGSEEHKISIRNFWESTLIPGMGMIEGALTKAFQKELGEGFFFKFDTSNVEALRDDLAKKAQIATQMLQAGLSINEVRAKIWEVEVLEDPDADDPFLLIQQRSNTVISPSPGTQSSSISLEDKDLKPKASKIKITEKIDDLRKLRTKQLADEEARTIKKFGELIIDMLVGMTEAAIDVIEKSNKALAVKDLPGRRVLDRRLRRVLTDQFEETWTNDYTRTLNDSVELGYDQSLDLVFNAEATREIQALRERDSEKRRLILEARGIDSFEGITKTHTERIMKQIEEGQRRNESITDITRRVASSLGTPGQLAGKAETIARTETLTAVSVGQGAALENAKEVIPDLKKTWLTSGDNRVRDSHASLDGDTISVDEKFGNGLRYPRDTKSSDPSEVINCRCTLLLLPPENEDISFEIP